MCVQTTGHLNTHIYVLTWEVVIWMYMYKSKNLKTMSYAFFSYVSDTPVDKRQRV